MAPLLGYWSLRGLAEPIRTLLAYAEVEYEEKLYHIGPPPNYEQSEWDAAKPKLGIAAPNLPYYIDGDIKMSESDAILRHLGRKYDLYGQTEEERVRIDVAQGVLGDLFFRGIVPVVFGTDVEEKEAALVADIDSLLKKCADILGNGPYIAGDKVSWVDFMLLEQLDRYELIAPGSVARHSTLADFHKRILAIPSIAKYRQSPVFQRIKTRFFGRECKIGGGEESY